MGVEKLTEDVASGITERFLYDHTDGTVGYSEEFNDALLRQYIADRRLAGPKHVEGLGYEIATLHQGLCNIYGRERGLPRNWYYRPEFNDEMRKLIALASDFNPHGKSM